MTHEQHLRTDILTRYSILRDLIRTEIGAETLERFDAEMNDWLLEGPPPAVDKDLVVVQDLSDLDDADDSFDRDEAIAARTTFSWIVRFDVSGTWVRFGP